MSSDNRVTDFTSDGYGCGICASCEPADLEGKPEEISGQSDQDLPEFGEWEVVCLLVHFEDTEPRGPPEEYEQFMFGDHPDVGRSEESVTNYWETVSHGQMTLSSGPEGVGGWYEVPFTEEEYENEDREYDLIWEAAVEEAKKHGFDFEAYDQPLLFVFRAGGSGPAWGGPGGSYAGESFSGRALNWTQPSISDLRMGVPCHEIGHALGLPHHYNDGVGDIALMSGEGTWNSPPSKLSAHEKNNIGPEGGFRISDDGRSDWTKTADIWLENDENLRQPLIIPPATAVDENYRIWDGTRGDGSRYIIEFRPSTGIDRNLSANGVAVYYYPENSEFDFPLASDSVDPNGETVDTADLSIRKPDAELDFTLETVETAYDCVLCNDPPERTISESNQCLHAIPVDLDDLPDGTRINDAGETKIDARVAWEAETDEIDLTLIDPDGQVHAESTTKNGTFAVVRSASLETDTPGGTWKLREEITGNGEVEYAKAINHPSYELAENVTVQSAVLDEESLEIKLKLTYGTGKRYDHGTFGMPDPPQFDLEVAGQSINPDSITVTDHDDDGIYLLEATDISASDGAELSLSYTDEKAGVTHTTNTDTETVETDNLLSLTVEEMTVTQEGEAELELNATAVSEIEITKLWTDWAVSDVTAPDAVVDSQVQSDGTCKLLWESVQATVTPEIIVAMPDRYIGGEFLLTLIATGEIDAAEKSVSLVIE